MFYRAPRLTFFIALRRCILVTMLVSLLPACSSVAEKVSSGISNRQLNNVLDQTYEKVSYERPDFGKLVAREKLPDGSIVMKHIGDFGEQNSGMQGMYGKQYKIARVIYFKVDKQGVIKDWATATYEAGAATCWVGFCGGGEKKQVPIEELDAIVKTSDGSNYSIWRG